jgi:Ni,Fe-hydrogenase I cytochrome b subunit
VGSQALQGLAQAVGEFAPSTLEDGGGADLGAKQSCIVTTTALLIFLLLVTVMLLWTQPHSTRRNFHAEMIPTALQAGICVSVALLAARRHSINETIAAGLQAALDASALLQPLLSVGLALYDATSNVGISFIIALIRALWAQ